MNPNIDNTNPDAANHGDAAAPSYGETIPTADGEPTFTARQMVDEQLAQFRAQILTLIEALNPYIDDGYPTYTHGAQLVKGNHLLSETLGIIRRESEE